MKVLIRADGNSKIGLGHVIRSCALAEMLRHNFECEFYIHQPSEYLKQEIIKTGCRLVEMPMAESYEKEAEAWSKTLTGKEIVVLDGYNFTTKYQQQLKKSNCKLVCIDDIHAYHFVADVIINHAGGIKPSYYSAEFNTQFYLGLKYSLLRKEFLTGRSIQAEPDTLFICLGGADPKNDLQRVLEKVVKARFKEIKILIGSGYQYKDALQKYLEGRKVPHQLYQNIDANQVALLMQSCSHAILSPSSISYEYMSFSGIVYLYQIAENQNNVKKYFIENKLAIDFCNFNEENNLNANVIEMQKQYFDNNSGYRILKIFESIAFTFKISSRKANPDDISITFEWANDLLARQMSFKTDPITIKEHSHWFLAKLNDGNSHYYIFEVDNTPIAQIRFDYRDDFYLLSYIIDQKYRGKGLGTFIIAEGIKQLKTDKLLPIDTIVGFVKKENSISCLCFEKMQFKREDASEYKNSFKYSLEI